MPYKDKEKQREYHKKYWKEYYIKNKDKITKYKKKWEEKNKEHCKKLREQWRKNNLERVKKCNRICQYKRRKTDIKYRMVCNLRRRLQHAIKKGFKSARTLELLGCSVEYLREYLEKQFKGEMNWNNYGSYWEVDHIIPCNSFDLTNPIEQRKCFNYTNLQPLQVRENRIKHTSIIYKKEGDMIG